MKHITYLIIIVCTLLTGACKTAKKTAQNDPSIEEINARIEEEIAATEHNSTTDVTVRSEKVKALDASNHAMQQFYVIIGSFRSVDNARQYNIGLQKEGFEPMILENENGLFRISVGGYDDEQTARNRIAGIRAAYATHRDVWLLMRK